MSPYAVGCAWCIHVALPRRRLQALPCSRPPLMGDGLPAFPPALALLRAIPLRGESPLRGASPLRLRCLESRSERDSSAPPALSRLPPLTPPATGATARVTSPSAGWPALARSPGPASARWLGDAPSASRPRALAHDPAPSAAGLLGVGCKMWERAYKRVFAAFSQCSILPCGACSPPFRRLRPCRRPAGCGHGKGRSILDRPAPAERVSSARSPPRSRGSSPARCRDPSRCLPC